MGCKGTTHRVKHVEALSKMAAVVNASANCIMKNRETMRRAGSRLGSVSGELRYLESPLCSLCSCRRTWASSPIAKQSHWSWRAGKRKESWLSKKLVKDWVGGRTRDPNTCCIIIRFLEDSSMLPVVPHSTLGQPRLAFPSAEYAEACAEMVYSFS
jgi:hypothetical protein